MADGLWPFLECSIATDLDLTPSLRVMATGPCISQGLSVYGAFSQTWCHLVHTTGLARWVLSSSLRKRTWSLGQMRWLAKGHLAYHLCCDLKLQGHCTPKQPFPCKPWTWVLPCAQLHYFAFLSLTSTGFSQVSWLLWPVTSASHNCDADTELGGGPNALPASPVLGATPWEVIFEETSGRMGHVDSQCSKGWHLGETHYLHSAGGVSGYVFLKWKHLLKSLINQKEGT